MKNNTRLLVISLTALAVAASAVIFSLVSQRRSINYMEAFDEESLRTTMSVNRYADGLGNNAEGVSEVSSDTSKKDKTVKVDNSKRKKTFKKKKLTILNTEWSVRKKYLELDKVGNDWGYRGEELEALSSAVTGVLTPTTVLWFDSDTIEYSHQGVGMDGIKLVRDDKKYKLYINIPLKDTALSDSNCEVLLAILSIFSSEPEELYTAVFDSYTSSETHGINEDKYTSIGDVKVKIKVINGKIEYLFKKA